MNPTKLLITIVKAKEFIEKAEIAKRKLDDWPHRRNGCKETAACRRVSMDLTRSLAELRRPG